MRILSVTLTRAAWAAAWVAAVLLARPARADQRPNILLILADDLGYSDLGCYGGEIDTPNIDALAHGGVRFTQLYNSARCCPSRASLMTGLYPSQAGIGDFTTARPSPDRGPGYLGRLNDQCATLAEVLKPAGYGCYYVGKWHMHEETGPIERGFDEFYGFTRDHSHDQYDADYYVRLPEGRTKEIDPPPGEFYATDVFNQYALEFIRQGRQSGKPWFLFLGHSSPHFPVQAPAERADKYDATYLRGWDVLREERFERMRKLGLIDGDRWKLTPRSLVPVDRDDIANGYSGRPNPAWDSLDEPRRRDLARRMAVFAAMVERVDYGVGQVVRALKAGGDFDNTLILFLSDNGACYEWGPFGFDGESRRGTTTLYSGEDLRKIGGPGTHQSYGSAWANLGNTPLRLYKHFTHEGGISTPFIAHWPKGIPAADRWIRQPAHVMDVMPTLVEAAGASYPAELNGHAVLPAEGTSLLPAIRGGGLPERSIGFDHQGAHALREGDWKLVWSKRMPHEITWELYNLAEDRCETTDLAQKYPERVEAMAAEWDEWARRVGVIYPAEGSAKARSGQEESNSPRIAQRPLAIVAEVNSPAPLGVVLAQGGREHGYALCFVGGKPAFDVRIDGQVTRLMAGEPARGAIRLEARLDRQTMSLRVNDQAEVAGPSPGLIPVEPLDELSVGCDARTAAGDYDAPNPFDGVIISTRVEAGGPPPAVAPAMDRARLEAGLESHDRALYVKEGWIRDPYIVLAPDGWFYLTGTTPNPGDPREKTDAYNTGLGDESIVGWKAQVWRSRDLIDWQSLGAPLTLKDGIWFHEQPDQFARMGHEGCLIRKIHGKYVLFGTGWSTGQGRRGSYNLYYATADKITGPYGERKFAGRFLGHGTPFQDKLERWWCTAFYNANVPPLDRRGIETRDLSDTAQTINPRGTTLVPLDVRLLDGGELLIRAKDPAYAAPGPDEVQDFRE